MKSSLLDNLGTCGQHGKFVGRECPLCDGVPSAPAPEPVAVTPAEDRSTWYPGPEKELHDMFCNAMHRYGVRFVHARTDVKSTIQPGWPDFTCMREAEGIARVCLVELKNRSGRASKDQEACIADLMTAGIPVLVTGDFREACDFVRRNLGLPDDPSPQMTRDLNPNDSI